ncbi:hypothetical protein [Microbacterium rhizomatis]|uniref:Uncharacterized protein n=1 Tax=Microbacterium rhizomatis TaxID=1631477 RepID=A0A5J5J873_9MICO|nr:hypothetical protein [Microbacterium rhizomatis]KAA9110988.1 hypothetical protein F6B43_05045 [Microbacterium rhizomatis]
MTAHFLFARFHSPDQRAAVDWLRNAEDIVADHSGVRAPESDRSLAGPVLAWRLVSDNQREIARGCRLYRHERAAMADIAALLQSQPELEVRAATAARVRSTGWFVTRADELVMMSARRYENRSAARKAGALALRLIGELAAAEDAPRDIEELIS